MPPTATARGMPRAARLARRAASLAAELFQRRVERARVVELLRLPLARRAAEGAGRELERQVLEGRWRAHAVDGGAQRRTRLYVQTFGNDHGIGLGRRMVLKIDVDEGLQRGVR